MSSFNTTDYDTLFAIGRELYQLNFKPSVVRENAVKIMAMVESVRGQQASWPRISKRYRHLTNYETNEIVKFPKRKNSKGV
jgi:hypothetical protein